MLVQTVLFQNIGKLYPFEVPLISKQTGLGQYIRPSKRVNHHSLLRFLKHSLLSLYLHFVILLHMTMDASQLDFMLAGLTTPRHLPQPAKADEVYIHTLFPYILPVKENCHEI